MNQPNPKWFPEPCRSRNGRPDNNNIGSGTDIAGLTIHESAAQDDVFPAMPEPGAKVSAPYLTDLFNHLTTLGQAMTGGE